MVPITVKARDSLLPISQRDMDECSVPLPSSVNLMLLPFIARNLAAYLF